MIDYFLLFIITVSVNNFVLVKFLGLCHFIGATKRPESAICIGFATTFVMTLSSILSWFMDNYILIPLDIIYLRTLSFILVIAVVVQFTEIVVRAISSTLYHLLGIFLPLISTNCAIIEIILLNINQSRNFLQSSIYGFSVGIGFSIVIILFSTIRERIEVANIPGPFRGLSIYFITAGIMSLAFMGFNGLVKY
ncbi:MAG: electron transport complex subunit RsxA [Arsenophonus sp.]